LVREQAGMATEFMEFTNEDEYYSSTDESSDRGFERRASRPKKSPEFCNYRQTRG
jgi:hypothetical protein